MENGYAYKWENKLDTINIYDKAMEKRIAYYRPIDPNTVWTGNIWKQFSKNISKHGIAHFEEGSLEELDFQKECSNTSIVFSRHTVLKCTGKDLYKHPFHYLSVKPDKDIYDIYHFIDFSDACKGTKDILCKENIKQCNKVTIDRKKSKNLDIMEIGFMLKPRIILISKYLKNLMAPLNYHGYYLVPCLEKGKQYTDNERRFKYKSKRLESEATYFQLIINEEVIQPEYVGSITRILYQCHTCNTLHGFYSDSDSFFHLGDLRDTDFQKSSKIRTSDGKVFNTTNESIIISSRVLNLFIDHKINGLFRFMTDPPIKHGVVEIKETPNKK